MARIRTIKPDFFRHLYLYQSEQETKLPLRVAFAGLWTASDREGRFKWEPTVLKLDCLPFDNIDFSRVLDALWTRGFIEKYIEKGKTYGFIPSWEDHQFINNRESPSILPEPNEINMLTCEGRVVDATEGEGKGRERKGKGIYVSCPENVSSQVWDDFLTHRKNKRATVTKTVIEGLMREAVKASISLEDALRECCSRGWQGFKAEWYLKDKQGQGVNNSPKVVPPSRVVYDDPTELWKKEFERDKANGSKLKQESMPEIKKLIGEMYG